MDAELRRRLDAIVARIGPHPTPSPGPQPDATDDDLAACCLDASLTPDARLAAARRLAERHRVDRGASNIVVALLADSDTAVVLGAIDLVQPFDQAAMDHLVRLLDHGSTAVRFAAARALGRRKDRAVAARLVPWIRGEDPQARRVAIEVITGILDDREAPRVLAALWERADLDDDERMRLAARLAAAGDDRVADWLLHVLESGHPLADAARRHLMALLDLADSPPDL
jgi:HEAT repeat protein